MLYVGICLYKRKLSTKTEKRQGLTNIEQAILLLQQSDDIDAKQSCAIAYNLLMQNAGERSDLSQIILNFQKSRPLYENYFGLDHLELARCYRTFGILCAIHNDTTLEPITLRHAITSLTTAIEIYRRQNKNRMKLYSYEMLQNYLHLGHCYVINKNIIMR